MCVAFRGSRWEDMPREKAWLACDQRSRCLWFSEARDQRVGAKHGAEAGAWLECEDCARQFQGERALWQHQQSKRGKDVAEGGSKRRKRQQSGPW